MSIVTTTMTDLLTDIKSTLLLYQDTTLSKINTWQKGVLSPLAKFPSIAILPVRENYIYEMTNNNYEVDREVVVECYDLKLGITQAKDNTIDMITATKDIFVDNLTFSGNCYTSEWNYEEYGNSIEVANGRLFLSSINLKCKSRESYPSLTVTGTTTNNVSTKDLQDEILSALKDNKTAEYSSVNTIVDSPIKPIGSSAFPAILIGAPSKSRNQTYPNSDIGTVYFNIAVVNQILPKEKSLNWVLSITEGVKNVLQTNYNFGGKCDFSNIRNITYSQSKAISGFLYNNVITLECLVREFQ